ALLQVLQGDGQGDRPVGALVDGAGDVGPLLDDGGVVERGGQDHRRRLGQEAVGVDDDVGRGGVGRRAAPVGQLVVDGPATVGRSWVVTAASAWTGNSGGRCGSNHSSR